MPYNPSPTTQARTPMGVSSYKTSTQADHSTTRKSHPSRWGTIVEVMKPDGANTLPFVKVRWEDTGNISEWVVLEDHPLSLSVNYSSTLEGLVGNYRVKVEMFNYRSGGGLAKIVGDKEVDILNYDPQLPSRGLKLI